ncbi:hypothetical protein AHMF7605_17065 [Adhaeribacter arboris]|uniref:Uncharacterized protein n=1 Tax=Adhaeribacter arboris TaxID=2072846 RepID=A0A2T2YHW9_9BACT|nr:hypothetical protein [Adhaeribacter arboris]PSR55092.1 hypothetical protein AHMF7605_17065 [Adhaeribacter arboris]
MSFLKQLLTPFVEFEDDKNKAQQNKPAIPLTPATSAPPAPASVAPMVNPTVPAPDENAQHPLITNSPAPVMAVNQTPIYSPGGTLVGSMPEHEYYFERLIDEANAKNPLFQGADFKEFVDSKVDIDDIQDEALKYKMAFNVLKSSGLTKEKLLSTGQEYLNIIGRDLNAFQSAHAQQYLKEVRSKEQIIQKKAEELQVLTQKMNALKAEINQITQEINLTKDQLNTTKNSFLLAGEKKQKEIQTELQKIAQYF